MYKDKCGTGYENSTRAIFQGAGEYDIPIIEPTKITENNFIGFNEVLSSKQMRCAFLFGRLPVPKIMEYTRQVY